LSHLLTSSDPVISVVGNAEESEPEARDAPESTASSPRSHGEQTDQRESRHVNTPHHRHDNEENEEFFDDEAFDTQEPITGSEAASAPAYMEAVDEEFEGFVEPPSASPQADSKTPESKDSAQPELKIAKVCDYLVLLQYFRLFHRSLPIIVFV
uniref:Clathrin light chain n=1 Tax=Schistocephalus solidus TaxID=70667 RepID=A0A183TQT6_SCHSO